MGKDKKEIKSSTNVYLECMLKIHQQRTSAIKNPLNEALGHCKSIGSSYQSFEQALQNKDTEALLLAYQAMITNFNNVKKTDFSDNISKIEANLALIKSKLDQEDQTKPDITSTKTELISLFEILELDKKLNDEFKQIYQKILKLMLQTNQRMQPLHAKLQQRFDQNTDTSEDQTATTGKQKSAFTPTSSALHKQPSAQPTADTKKHRHKKPSKSSADAED